ncbi:hypothetical protein [Mahella sp.]|uniref:hypothetical protein n=1 Tax=Mahella sp. TaxID=2798721 RepID=UPI0024AAAFC3|nr:hypothetical protein [Mahella sp.]MBZ4666401.1 hypothetical protein [Mahella sp.]MDI3508269.1 hypothetical protein [Clostridiales bacterium]
MHLKQCFVQKFVTIILAASLLMTAPLTIAAAESPDEGPVASVAAVSANISTTPTSFSEKDIRNGNTSIIITLNEAQWKENAFTSSRDLTTLMNGFVAASQTDQWKLVQSAKNIGTTLVNSSTLMLTFPSIPNYDITRDQTVSVTIPKSLIEGGTSDISAGSFTIKCETAKSLIPLEGAIQNGTLTHWFNYTSPRNILINVPEHHVNVISISQKQLSSTYIITIVDVTTTDKVSSVSVTGNGITRSTSEYISSGNTRIFSIGFTEIQPGADITISAKGGNDPVQKDIAIKVKSGKTTYNQLPKSPLHGWYTIYNLITDGKLLDSVLSYYSLSELKIGLRDEVTVP